VNGCSSDALCFEDTVACFCCLTETTIATSNVKPLAILATVDLRPKSSVFAGASSANEDIISEGTATDLAQEPTQEEVSFIYCIFRDVHIGETDLLDVSYGPLFFIMRTVASFCRQCSCICCAAGSLVRYQ
jgi:hypothetical protein